MNKINLTREKATLLATLYARATESKSSSPIIKDEMAEQAIQKIDYDFLKLKVDVIGISMRAKQFDNWTNDFLARNPKAIVLQLGCGLDSRVYRINPTASVKWYDVDYPEVIELRSKLYPERQNYTTIGESLENTEWINQIQSNIPVFVILEGVSMYLNSEIMNSLLRHITSHFKNGEIAFDAISKSAFGMAKRNKAIKETGATFGGFYVNNTEDLKQVAPQLQLVSESVTHKMPGYYKLPFAVKIAVRIFDAIPSLRKMSRILYYKF
jgi:O-methyltransferase involved in polyketide biosynthesis